MQMKYLSKFNMQKNLISGITIVILLFHFVYCVLFSRFRNLNLPSDTSYKLKLFMDFKE